MSKYFSDRYRYIPRAAAACGALLLLAQLASSQAQTGKLPVIVIPGLTGSELVNGKTKETVWFSAQRSKADDISLPISANIAANTDDLVAGDILREVKVGLVKVQVYGILVKALTDRGGYAVGNWDNPAPGDYQDTVYVFPYDWRRDNVENARLLARRVKDLKAKLKRPGLKFNIVAHSMGGYVARYAAMYGDADLPAGNAVPKPTWAGASDFNRLIILGTPNEGSALSLNSLLNGFAVGGIQVNLPFVRNPSKFDVFTLPSAYQLLPAPGTLRAFDENLQPLQIDLYDPQTWTKYGWGALEDKNFDKNYSAAERAAARTYFANVLSRAKRLYDALDAVTNGKIPVSFDLVGGDCEDTLDSIVIYRDKKSGSWKTLFKPQDFTRSDGKKVSAAELKKIMMAPGDSVVTKRSLLAATLAKNANVSSVFSSASNSNLCAIHNRQPTITAIQDKIIELLASGHLARNGDSRYINTIAN
jgi:pimeloyl-ACP methyl ester carboxylesterase